MKALLVICLLLAGCTNTKYLVSHYEKMEAGQPTDTIYQTGGIFIVENFQPEYNRSVSDNVSTQSNTYYHPRHKSCLKRHTVLQLQSEGPYYTIYRCLRCNKLVYVRKLQKLTK